MLEEMKEKRFVTRMELSKLVEVDGSTIMKIKIWGYFEKKDLYVLTSDGSYKVDTQMRVDIEIPDVAAYIERRLEKLSKK